jgi:hypothetical protein
MKRALAIAGIVATSLVVPSATASAASAGWVVAQAQSISGSNFYLRSIDSPQRGDVWTVGYRYTYIGGALEFRTVAEHSTGGGSFTLVPTPDIETAPAQDFLRDVSGSSSMNVWAVGTSSGGPGPETTMIMRWAGSQWTLMTSPNPGQYGNDLEGVAALSSKNVWAVGARQDTFYQSPLALHWNGRNWQAVATPNPSYCDEHSYLTDISALSSTDIWASGWCESSIRHADQGYIEHWDGSAWTIQADDVFPAGSELYGVSASDSGNVWAVGLQSGAGVSVPVNTPYGSLSGVAVDKFGKIWATGTQLPGQYNQPLIVYREV